MKYIYVVTTSRGATLHYSSRKAAELAAKELAERDGYTLGPVPAMAGSQLLDWNGKRTGTELRRHTVNGHDLTRFAWPRREF